ncbi:MAG: hypothetical protein LBL91_01125 [Lachnospiraceae bacterium]|jgi:hypothetical protein|nr:hypothetical protein [Lachnospiraceae bacterium]
MLRILKIKPYEAPVLDEIEVLDSICYMKNDRGSELEKMELLESNRELKFIQLEEYIFAICLNPKFLACDEDKNRYYDGYPVEENRQIDGVDIYGDIIVIKKIADKYYSLTIDEMDKYMYKLKGAKK